MTTRGISGRIRRRATARGGAVLAAVLMAGMIPGAQASAGSREIDVELGYACDFPSGEREVKVRVSATLPDEGKADEALLLSDVSTELTLPADSTADLEDAPTETQAPTHVPSEATAEAPAEAAAGADAEAGAEAVSVEAQTRLTVDVAQGGHSAQAVWAGSTENPVDVPDTGDLTLTASGAVPSVTAADSGGLTFTAGKLTALLTSKKADGSPARTQALGLVCTPRTGQDLTLGKVEIGGGGDTVPWPTEAGDEPGTEGGERDVAAPRVGAADAAPDAGEAPPCVGDREDPFHLVAYITGYANVTKLNGAARFPVACAKITQGPQGFIFPGNSPDGKLHLVQDSTAVVDYRGRPQLPPATATFLTFGFMPTTAKMEMTQQPLKVGDNGLPVPNVHSDFTLAGLETFGSTVITMNFRLRLYDVRVNGVALDVGPDCRTSKDFPLSLLGEMKFVDGGFGGYTLTGGGPLKGSVTVPPFSGCGVGEDLDSLFTASISGESGYVKQIQGPPCAALAYDTALCTEDRQPRNIPTAER